MLASKTRISSVTLLYALNPAIYKKLTEGIQYTIFNVLYALIRIGYSLRLKYLEKRILLSIITTFKI